MATLFNVPVTRILVIALLALIGCKDSDKNSSLIFEELNESLERSNKAIKLSTIRTLENLKQKIEEPSTAEKGELWMKKAMMILEASNSLDQFIDSLRKTIKQNEAANSYAAKAEKSAFEILVNQKYGNRLFDSLKNYRTFLFSVDRNLDRIFRERTNYSDSFFLSKSKSPDEFTMRLFKEASVIQAICLLEKIKNTVLLTGNELIVFCRDNVPSSSGWYQRLQLVAISNREHYKNGDELKIESGIGAFNTNSSPSIIINRKKIELNENGVAVFKSKIKSKPGKYSIPVKVEYTDFDGKRQFQERLVEYQVDE